MSGPAGAPLLLPWKGASVPHAVLEVVQGCNIECAACINESPSRPVREKPLVAIEAELDSLLRLRRLHTVTLSGGEPTLHRDLPEVVRRVRRRGLCASVLTNGVLLDDDLARRLGEAGTSLVFLHVDAGQRRPDLPAGSSVADLWTLQRAFARRVSTHGMTAGLTTTVRPETLPAVTGLVERFLAEPALGYLLLTPVRVPSSLPWLEGDVERGVRRRAGTGGPPPGLGEIDGAAVAAAVGRAGLVPFSRLGSSHDPSARRWLSFMAAALERPRGEAEVRPLHPGHLARAAVRLLRLRHGRFVFFHVMGPARLRSYLLWTALAGIAPAASVRFVLRSLGRGRVLRSKHVIIEEPPRLEPDGTVSFCRDCPDATLLDGRLVPGCLSHHLAVPPPSAEVQTCRSS